MKNHFPDINQMDGNLHNYDRKPEEITGREVNSQQDVPQPMSSDHTLGFDLRPPYLNEIFTVHPKWLQEMYALPIRKSDPDEIYLLDHYLLESLMLPFHFRDWLYLVFMAINARGKGFFVPVNLTWNNKRRPSRQGKQEISAIEACPKGW